MSAARSSSPRARVDASVRSVLGCVALLAALGGALAGCGSSSPPGTSAEPARAVPASAVLYVGATVRPTGAQKTSALAAGKAFTGQADPYLRLLAALQTPGSPQLNFARDVAPWLGPHAGAFLTSLGSSSSALLSLLEQGLLGSATSSAFPFSATGAQGAIVLDTSDATKAQSFLNAQAKRAGAHASSYRGVSYQVSAGGVAFGIVDRFAVIGSESGLRGVIETTHGGGSLASASGYSKLLAKAPSEALAHIYSNPTAGEASPASGSQSSAVGEGLSSLIALLAGRHEANISLLTSAGTLALDADTLSSPASSASAQQSQGEGLLAADPQGAQALAELPGESWLAIGLGHVGAGLAQDVQGLQDLGSLFSSPQEGTAGLSLSSVLKALITPLNALAANTAQARHDFTSWMSSGGIFASGASLLELKGAVVFSSTNPAASRLAVSKLADQLRAAGASVSPAKIAGTEAAMAARVSGLPVVLDIADGRGANGQAKFVLGIGEASVGAALNPPSALAGSAPHDAAVAALGEGTQPSLIVGVPTFLSLIEGLGLSEAPGISKFVPYLRSLTTLSGGGHSLGGDVERFRLVLGLAQAGG